MDQILSRTAVNPAEFDCRRFEILTGGSIGGHSAICDTLLACWRQKYTNGRMPSRNMIRLCDLRGMAPHIGILDVVQDPGASCGFRLPIRLSGTAIVAQYGEWTGREIRDLQEWPGPARRVCHMVRTMLDLRAPVMSSVEGVCSTMPFKDSHTLYLPLSSDGSDIDKVMLVLDISYQQEKIA